MHFPTIFGLSLTMAAVNALVLPGTVSQDFDLEKRNPNLQKRGLCTPTGPGVCNFGLTNQIPTLADEEQYVYIFDRDCNTIGYKANPDGRPFDLYSQLPYTLVITDLSARLDAPHIAFKYGASSIDSDNGQCACSDCSDDLAACTSCQCAFDC